MVPGRMVAPSATHVNANGAALPLPPPVYQLGLVALEQGLELCQLLNPRLPLGTWSVKSKLAVGGWALATAGSIRKLRMYSLPKSKDTVSGWQMGRVWQGCEPDHTASLCGSKPGPLGTGHGVGGCVPETGHAAKAWA